MLKHVALGLMLFGMLPAVAAAEESSCTGSLSVAESFTCLYSIFPRGAGSDTIGGALADEFATSDDDLDGPLVLINGYGIFIYDGSGDDATKLLDHVLTRSDQDPGFIQMTALSHVGPAIAYLAALAEEGSASYPALRDALLERIRAVRTSIAADPGWQGALDVAAWTPHADAINAMIDYGLWMAEDNLVKVRDGTVDFTEASVGSDFYNGGLDGYAVPFDNVMIATFMLVDLDSSAEVRDLIAKLEETVDFSKARVVVYMSIGTNYGAGLTAATNQLVYAAQVLSDDAIGDENVLIAPYAVAPCQPAGAAECPLETFTASALADDVYTFYSTTVWSGIYDRTQIAKNAFTGIAAIPETTAPAIPGDYGVTAADDIDGFMQRLRNSLLNKTELLSNAVGFSMPGELRAKNWDVASVDIPGLTTGFPSGVTAYPTDLPDIPE